MLFSKKSKTIRFEKKIPEFVIEWLDMQTDKYEALYQIIQNEVRENGLRDLSNENLYNDSQFEQNPHGQQMNAVGNQGYTEELYSPQYGYNQYQQAMYQQQFSQQNQPPHGEVKFVNTIYNNQYEHGQVPQYEQNNQQVGYQQFPNQNGNFRNNN